MDEIEWNIYNESQLFEAMAGHKPVGVNKYFQMAFICDKFSEHCQKEISSEKVWRHLETMYNLEALDESESIPFPNMEKDFALPESDFGNLLIKKEEDKKQVQKGRETPKPIKEVKKEEKSTIRNSKERRDSRDSKDNKDNNKSTGSSVKKEVKKEGDKQKANRGRPSSTSKDDSKPKNKTEDNSKPAKRPTRGSLKPDDSSSSGKSSPVNVSTPNIKRRRI